MTKKLIEEAREHQCECGGSDCDADLIRRLADALEKSQRGGATLGKIIKQQCEDIVKITRSEDLILPDGDGDYETVWERGFKMRADLDALAARQPTEDDGRVFKASELTKFVQDALDCDLGGIDGPMGGGFGCFEHEVDGTEFGNCAEAEHIADKLFKAIPALSRAAVPDAATEGDSLAKVMDTLAYYHCRSVNPKADHPRMGYHAMSVDQREHLREKQREAAEEIVRMLPSLSNALVRKQERYIEELESVDSVGLKAERDAALEAIERVRAIHEPFVRSFIPGETMYCRGCAVAGRGEKLWPCVTVAALDGAPEPEWEYTWEYRGVPQLNIRNEYTKTQRPEDRFRRRPAGPWLPVEGESNGDS